MASPEAGLGLLALVLVLSFATSVLSGLLGIGGGIVMAPALLYLPPLLGVGGFDMKQVGGLTITQGLFACLSGVARHDAQRQVDRSLVAWMGGSVAVSALAGSLLSGWISAEVLMAIFAGLAIAAAALMLLPIQNGEPARNPSARECDRSRAVLIAVFVGVFGGMVGQGGSFLLIPLMIVVLRLPTRVVIGSNLGIVTLSSLAGFAGKLATGQILLSPAVCLVAGAVPGARLGSSLSLRSSPKSLRIGLALVIALAAFRIAFDALGRLLA